MTRRVGGAKALDEYSLVAYEYYDAIRHPTCRNFRDASIIYIRSALNKIPNPTSCLDVGAGRSALAEIFLDSSLCLRGVALLDQSEAMLSCSKAFLQLGATGVIGEATRLPFKGAGFQLIVASLGDPFNTPDFWSEVSRCLAPAGYCVFTMPSHDWATGFRTSKEKEKASLAYFELADGRIVYAPSLIYSTDEQCALVKRFGLEVIETSTVDVRELSSPLSNKLKKSDASDFYDPVVGFLIRKPGL